MAAEDDDRRAGDGRPLGDDPFSLADLVVPDDARELEPDMRALYRERRMQARRDRLRRLPSPGRGGPRGLAVPVMAAVLVLAAAFASLTMLFQPRRGTAGRPGPLASGVRAVGEEGGLVPDVTLRLTDGSSLALRDQRPAVVAVVPVGCGCVDRLRDVGLTTLNRKVRLLLVGTGMPPPPAGLPERGPVRAAEPAGALARAYRVGTDPVVLLVRGDGVVNRVLARPPSATALDAELAVLVAAQSVP